MLPADKQFDIYHGDCIPHMAEMEPASMDFAVFSPPFPSMFAYTDSPADIGNSDDVDNESKIHLRFFFRQLTRVVKPGRAIVVHVANIPRLARTGGKGTVDFRGLTIRIGERCGLIYQYDWAVLKNPQIQAIRTRSRSLQFTAMERDRAGCAGAQSDFLIKFLVPGGNLVPVQGSGVSRIDWISWAEGAWDWRDVRQTDTLNTAAAKSEDDTKHICPLQLGVIDRLVRLFTNENEIVFSPFAGIGSEGYQSLLNYRRFYGCELKDEYHTAAMGNCDKAIAMRTRQQQENLFSAAAL